MARKRTRRRKRKVLSADEAKQLKFQRDHRKLIRSIFRLTGFTQIKSISKELTFMETTSDIDDVFLFENVIVVAEYTVLQDSYISTHLRKKKTLFDKIRTNQAKFAKFLIDTFPTFSSETDDTFEPRHYRVAIVYCSRNLLRLETKQDVPGVIYLDYNIARYFESIARTVRKSARFELFQFLELDYSQVGQNVLQPPTNASDIYRGSVLPENYSHFGAGFKVISFYLSPGALLERCYVLRRQGWREDASVYQRMISRAKIKTVRKYLLDKSRVFVNNIVVTLPDETRLLDDNRRTLDVSGITETQPVQIQLPKSFNSIGIIDGQHRVFSYHEGGSNEGAIARLRKQQNLLVTGVIFPAGASDERRSKFEATLFLEINSNQTKAKSDLKQEIGLMLRPFDADSIAKRVVSLMNDRHGPLSDEFERYFYDKDKIKTTSVVSFGIRPAVNLASEDSLFVLWKHRDKKRLLDKKDEELLAEYIDFCVAEINHLISAAKAKIPRDKWTPDRKVEGRFLTTTNINGLVGCIRRFVRRGKLRTVPQYIAALDGLDKFPFRNYKSSQYNKLAQELYDRYFASARERSASHR